MRSLSALPIIIALCPIFFFQCGPSFRLPVEEINRPLSLPPKNWEIGLPMQYVFAGKSSGFALGRNEGLFLGGSIYPTISLTDRLELAFSLLTLKYYPVKNVIARDSTLCINGLNWAIGAGYTGTPFSGQYDFVPVNMFSEVKYPVRKNIWFLSRTIISLWKYSSFPQNFSAEQEIGVGFQLTRKLYTKISADFFHSKATYFTFFDSTWSSGNAVYFEDGVRDSTFSESSISLPIVFGYNCSKKWKLYLYGEPWYVFLQKPYVSVGAGFDFYW